MAIPSMRCSSSLLALLVTLARTTQAHAAIPALERPALIALYQDSDGDHWANESGWKPPPLAGDGFAMPGTECGWYGVFCDVGETTVLAIGLESSALNGNIAPELGNLANLQFLFLSSNQLSGAIPSELDAFLEAKQIGGDRAGCQLTAAPTMSTPGVATLWALLLLGAVWATHLRSRHPAAAPTR